MTREEAIEYLNTLYMALAVFPNQQISLGNVDEMKESVSMAIKALEQEPCDKCVYSTKDGYCQYDDISETIPTLEPCDDVVSMEAVIEWLKVKDIIKMSSQEETARKELKALSSVRPQEQTGRWEEIVEEHKCYARDDTYTTKEYHCSECGAEPFVNEDGFYELSNYCPSCGSYNGGD